MMLPKQTSTTRRRKRTTPLLSSPLLSSHCSYNNQSIMPKELPGFYYDAEKNRYFPYKGPIPGSSKPKPKPPTSIPPSLPAASLRGCTKMRQDKLIQARELCGNIIISSRKGKLSFKAEYLNRHASRPLIWKYNDTEKMANIALEHVVADVISLNGIMRRDILLSGGVNRLLRLFQIRKAGEEIDSTPFNYKADHIRPHGVDQTGRHKQLLGHLGSSYAAMMPSDITCIKVSKKRCPATDNTMPKHLVITTLGSDTAPGSVYLLDLSKPLDFNASIPIARDGIHELAAFKQTLWTADSDPEGRRVVIGTNRGAALLNMETGVPSWVFRCKSDVLSLQFDQTGKSILCGLRNGAIVTVDTRQKQIKRNTHSSSTISMPTSVCCLTSLKIYDQYFLASSMDGSIKLYDHRIIHRGAVQSYEGNVNSHTRIELGVDPSEKVVMSGGEDCYLRLWNIKSGELLVKDRFMDSTPSAVCWPINRGILSFRNDRQDNRSYWEEHCWGAWLGSAEGIFYMDWL